DQDAALGAKEAPEFGVEVQPPAARLGDCEVLDTGLDCLGELGQGRLSVYRVEARVAAVSTSREVRGGAVADLQQICVPPADDCYSPPPRDGSGDRVAEVDDQIVVRRLHGGTLRVFR